MLHTRFFLFIGFAVFASANCASSRKTSSSESLPSLAEVFKNEFTIGTAINPSQVNETDSAVTALIRTQYNTLTPENVMKAALIHPEWNRYNFEPADKLIAFAKKYNMKVNAHTMIWHSQVPPFIRKGISTDSMKTFMREHIQTVGARYNKQVETWDVVNEALNEDGSMRKSVFLETLGDDFVTEAFRLAQQASPDCKLYYNDFNIEQPKKRAGAIALIKKIQAAGVRIDGVGIQGHWKIGKMPLKEIEESIQQFSALGIEVAFTELDIDVLPRSFEGAEVSQRMRVDSSSNPYAKGLPDSVQLQLAEDYAALFKLFTKYQSSITRITFWGAYDGATWLNNWPVRGRTNYPLLFDRQLKPKPAFQKVIAVKSLSKTK